MTAMQKTVRAVTTALVVVFGFGLAGCVSPAAPTPSPSSQTTTAAPTPIPTPSAPQLAEPSSCDAVLTQAGFDDLASGNLALREFSLQSWDYPLLGAIASDGIVCKWAGGGDVYVILGQLPMDESSWNTTQEGLEAEGYVESDNLGISGFLDGPDGSDESYPVRGFAWRDGILYYASYPGILEFVPAFEN